MTALPNELAARGGIDVREAFIDASFAPAKRGLKVGQTKRGNGTRIMAVADRHGLAVLVCVRVPRRTRWTRATSPCFRWLFPMHRRT